MVKIPWGAVFATLATAGRAGQNFSWWFRPDCPQIVGVVVARDVWFMMSIGLIVVAAAAAIVFFVSLRYPY